MLLTLCFSDRPEEHHVAHFLLRRAPASIVTTEMPQEDSQLLQPHNLIEQQEHRGTFGVHPIRAFLGETTSEARGKRLTELVGQARTVPLDVQ